MKTVFIFIIFLMLVLSVLIILWPLRKHKRIWWLAGLIPVAGIVGYLFLGSASEQFHYWKQQRQAAIVKAELAKVKSPQVIIERMERFLKQHPERAKGWYLLGKVYLDQQRYAKAYRALQKSHRLTPANNDYAVSYAQASFFFHHKRLPTSDVHLLKKIINIEPNNVAALNLLAIDAYMKKRYHSAIKYWKRLLKLFPAGSKDSDFLLQMIAQASSTINK